MDAKLEISPLPWRVVVTGRDTPNGCAELRDADGYSVIKRDCTVRRDDAFFIERSITEGQELINTLKELMLRCDGEEGIRPDGSNIDTAAASALLNRIGEL